MRGRTGIKPAARDYCGPTVPVIDHGEVLPAHVFVAVLGASNYTYAEATWSERWILARLRHHTFFSLAELDRCIGELLVDLNERPFQKLPGSRPSQFEALDKPELKPLPAEPYTYADWKWVKPGLDYHVEYKEHHYSVPQRLVGQELEIRATAEIVEVFHKGDRVASHARSRRSGGFTTCPEHMPNSHRAHQEWSPRRFLNWAGSIGPSTYKMVEWQLTNRPHPEHGYRRCLGLRSSSPEYAP